jgi:hypothetical protein
MFFHPSLRFAAVTGTRTVVPPGDANSVFLPSPTRHRRHVQCRNEVDGRAAREEKEGGDRGQQRQQATENGTPWRGGIRVHGNLHQVSPGRSRGWRSHTRR